MKQVIIVIPIYKEVISLDEEASLKQCIKVLGKHPISIVCPENLDTEQCENFFKKGNIDYSINRFSDKFFKNLKMYSKLLLDSNFYKEFLNYEFVLLYQLDAWVFNDELEFWCNKNYDYIGAPWFVVDSNGQYTSELSIFAGNGGLSLRKIKGVLSVLDKKLILSFKEILDYNKNVLFIVRHIISIIGYLKQYLNISFSKNYIHHEDGFYSIYAKRINAKFRVAPSEVALKFSFEVNPRLLYKLNKNSLPFGCHAFRKYGWDFWKDYIKIT